MSTPVRYDELGTINAVKILPKIDSYNGYIQLYTELDSHIEVGDYVFITYSGNTIDLNLETDVILDNYLYVLYGEDFLYNSISQGYEVLYVDKYKNLIVINRNIYTIPSNTNLYNHYISSVVCNNITISNGTIDGTILKNAVIGSGTTEINNNLLLTQGVLLNGNLYNCDINDKYSNNYISLKLEYKESNNTFIKHINLNNDNFGYLYFYDLNSSSEFIKNCNIYSGNYYNCSIDSDETLYNNGVPATGITIDGGYFNNCDIKYAKIYDGYLYNSTLTRGNCKWYYGKWNGGVFNLDEWQDGIFLNGIFGTGDTSIWQNGSFYNGTWKGLVWINGKFLGGTFEGVGKVENSRLVNSEWLNGEFRGGKMLNSTNNTISWNDGKVLGGELNNVIFNKSSIYDGTFYNVSVKNSEIHGGDFKVMRNNLPVFNYFAKNTIYNGNFIGDWYNPVVSGVSYLNNYALSSYTSGINEFSDSTIKNGVFKYSNFYNFNTIENGDFENTFFYSPTTIDNGKFYGGISNKVITYEYETFIDNDWASWAGGYMTFVVPTGTTIKVGDFVQVKQSAYTSVDGVIHPKNIQYDGLWEVKKIKYGVNKAFDPIYTNLTSFDIIETTCPYISNTPDGGTLQIIRTEYSPKIKSENYSFSKATIRNKKLYDTYNAGVIVDVVYLEFDNGHNFIIDDAGKNIKLVGFNSQELYNKEVKISAVGRYKDPSELIPTPPVGYDYRNIDPVGSNYIIVDELWKDWYFGDSGVVKRCDWNFTSRNSSEFYTINDGVFTNTLFSGNIDIYDGVYNNAVMRNGINFRNGIFNGNSFQSLCGETMNTWYNGKFYGGEFGNNTNGLYEDIVFSIFNEKTEVIDSQEGIRSATTYKLEGIYPYVYSNVQHTGEIGAFTTFPNADLPPDITNLWYPVINNDLSKDYMNSDVWNKIATFSDQNYKISPYSLVFKISSTDINNINIFSKYLDNPQNSEWYVDIITQEYNVDIKRPYKSFKDLFDMNYNYAGKYVKNGNYIYLVFEFEDIKNLYKNCTNSEKVAFDENFRNVWSIANTGYYTNPLPVLNSETTNYSTSYGVEDLSKVGHYIIHYTTGTSFTQAVNYPVPFFSAVTNWIYGTLPPVWWYSGLTSGVPAIDWDIMFKENVGVATNTVYCLKRISTSSNYNATDNSNCIMNNGKRCDLINIDVNTDVNATTTNYSNIYAALKDTFSVDDLVKIDNSLNPMINWSPDYNNGQGVTEPSLLSISSNLDFPYNRDLKSWMYYYINQHKNQSGKNLNQISFRDIHTTQVLIDPKFNVITDHFISTPVWDMGKDLIHNSRGFQTIAKGTSFKFDKSIDMSQFKTGDTLYVQYSRTIEEPRPPISPSDGGDGGDGWIGVNTVIPRTDGVGDYYAYDGNGDWISEINYGLDQPFTGLEFNYSGSYTILKISATTNTVYLNNSSKPMFSNNVNVYLQDGGIVVPYWYNLISERTRLNDKYGVNDPIFTAVTYKNYGTKVGLRMEPLFHKYDYSGYYFWKGGMKPGQSNPTVRTYSQEASMQKRCYFNATIKRTYVLPQGVPISNVVVNGTFSSTDSNWALNNFVVEDVSLNAPAGSSAYMMSYPRNSVSSKYGTLIQSITVVTGVTYRLKAMMRYMKYPGDTVSKMTISAGGNRSGAIYPVDESNNTLLTDKIIEFNFSSSSPTTNIIFSVSSNTNSNYDWSDFLYIYYVKTEVLADRTHYSIEFNNIHPEGIPSAVLASSSAGRYGVESYTNVLYSKNKTYPGSGSYPSYEYAYPTAITNSLKYEEGNSWISIISPTGSTTSSGVATYPDFDANSKFLKGTWLIGVSGLTGATNNKLYLEIDDPQFKWTGSLDSYTIDVALEPLIEASGKLVNVYNSTQNKIVKTKIIDYDWLNNLYILDIFPDTNTLSLLNNTNTNSGIWLGTNIGTTNLFNFTQSEYNSRVSYANSIKVGTSSLQFLQNLHNNATQFKYNSQKWTTPTWWVSGYYPNMIYNGNTTPFSKLSIPGHTKRDYELIISSNCNNIFRDSVTNITTPIQLKIGTSVSTRSTRSSIIFDNGSTTEFYDIGRRNIDVVKTNNFYGTYSYTDIKQTNSWIGQTKIDGNDIIVRGLTPVYADGYITSIKYDDILDYAWSPCPWQNYTIGKKINTDTFGNNMQHEMVRLFSSNGIASTDKLYFKVINFVVTSNQEGDNTTYESRTNIKEIILKEKMSKEEFSLKLNNDYLTSGHTSTYISSTGMSCFGIGVYDQNYIYSTESYFNWLSMSEQSLTWYPYSVDLSNRYNFQDIGLFSSYFSYINTASTSYQTAVLNYGFYNLFRDMYSGTNTHRNDYIDLATKISDFERWNKKAQTSVQNFNKKAGIQIRSKNLTANKDNFTDVWIYGQFYNGIFDGQWQGGQWIDGVWSGWNSIDMINSATTQFLSPTKFNISSVDTENYVVDYEFLKKQKLYYEIAPWDSANKKNTEIINPPIRKEDRRSI